MAKLKDLKDVAQNLANDFKRLAELAGTNTDVTDKGPENAIIAQLDKLVNESGQETPATLEERSAAIVTARRALTDLLIEAAKNPMELDEVQVMVIEDQRLALQSAHGHLLERRAFDPIAQLLSPADIQRIRGELTTARQAVADRRKAAEVIDTMVDVAVNVSKIAVMLA